MDNQQQNQQQIQIKVPDEILKGVYSNMMQVSHTPEEFTLDFMNIFSGAGSLVSRVVISPNHLKRVIAALQDNLSRYEKSFGSVKDVPVNVSPAVASSTNPGMGFDTNKAE